MEVDNVQNAIKVVLTLPMVERFRASIFNPNELQPLSSLLTLFGAALDAVIKNQEKLTPPSFSSLFLYPSPPSLLETDLDEMVESMEETYLREEDKIRQKIIRKRVKKEKRKAEKKVVRIGKVIGEEADMRIEYKKREKQHAKKRRKRKGKQLRKLLCPSPLFPHSPSSPLS